MKVVGNIDLTFYAEREHLTNEMGFCVNRHNCTPKDIITYHWHDFYEMELVVEGKALHTVNGKTYTLTPGDMYLVTSSDFHSLRFDTPNVILYSISFLSRALPAFLMKKISNLGFSCISLSKKQFERMRSELDFFIEQHEAEKRTTEKHLEKNAFERILLLYLQYLFPNGDADKQMKHVQPIQKVLAYVMENYAKQITLEDAARVAGMETTYFSRYFKQNMSLRFVPYLNKIRCSVAEAYLSSTEMPVEQIAALTGYASSSYFSKVFNNAYGQSPASYRKQRRDGFDQRGEKGETE